MFGVLVQVVPLAISLSRFFLFFFVGGADRAAFFQPGCLVLVEVVFSSASSSSFGGTGFRAAQLEVGDR